MSYETEDYKFAEMRVGATIINRQTGQSVYFQPGDDSAEIISQIDLIGQEFGSDDERMRNHCFNVICSQYV